MNACILTSLDYKCRHQLLVSVSNRRAIASHIFLYLITFWICREIYCFSYERYRYVPYAWRRNCENERIPYCEVAHTYLYLFLARIKFISFFNEILSFPKCLFSAWSLITMQRANIDDGCIILVMWFLCFHSPASLHNQLFKAWLIYACVFWECSQISTCKLLEVGSVQWMNVI